MKKYLAFMVMLILAASIMSGCLLMVPDETKNVHSGNAGTTTETKKPGDDVVPTTQTVESGEVTVDEEVVYDQNQVRITVLELREGWAGSELKVCVENNSEKNIVFTGDNFIVNGITISGYAYIDVAAGKKSNEAIDFYADQLETAGIDCIATIEAPDAHIYDSDSYDELFATPFSITTSAGADYRQTIRDEGDVIFSEAGIVVVAQKYTDSIWGPAVRLLVKNETGKNVIISAENISVNDYTISAWLYDVIYKDTVRYCELDIFNSELEENGIEKVENITFSLNIIEDGTFDRIVESGELKVVVSE